ncbi:MAG: hypothetical protein LBF16_15085 [Pseudomonadales bacterium]|jgi:hypothetical protein|nr:hypothetical protein [Pseudomonadales bacterium]
MTSYPKSYLPDAEREEMRRSGLSENSIIIAESEAADLAGDDDVSWAWLRLAKIPADFLLTLKHDAGADYVRKLGLNLAPAEAIYGRDWLDNPVV